MEMRIMFLIVAILALYLLFSQRGQEWLRKYVGIDVQTNSSSTSPGTKNQIIIDQMHKTLPKTGGVSA